LIAAPVDGWHDLVDRLCGRGMRNLHVGVTDRDAVESEIAKSLAAQGSS
jgi:hypothetical protein